MSAEVFDPTARRLDAAVAAVQRDGLLPSVVAGVVRDEALVWSSGRGQVPGPVGDTQYRIGSITKTLTAVLLLREEWHGRLDLADPLGALVPEAPWADRSLRSLLSHSAGLPAEPAGEWWERYGRGDFAHLVAANRTAPADPTGSPFRYSNIAFGLLGEAAARLHGGSWFDAVQAQILRPLGMNRTSYRPEGAHAQGFSVSELFGTLTPEPASDTGALAPAGQLWSTLDDLGRYARFLIAGHDEVLPGEALDAAMTTLQPNGNYGLGFRRIDSPNGDLFGHTGTMPGFMAGLFVDRGRGTGAIALANATVGLDTVTTIRTLHGIVEDCEPWIGPTWQPATSVPEQVLDLVGTWFWGERAFDVRWTGQDLAFVERRDAFAWEEFTQRDGRWIGTDGSELEVQQTAQGTELVCTTFRFRRTPSVG